MHIITLLKLRDDVKELESECNRTEDDLKATQSVGMSLEMF